MKDLFYRAFEDRHRGTRDQIKARLKVYLPFVLPVCAMYPDGLVLDLGCGRGEWLQLLQEHGVRGQGVDLDEGMLEACHAQGLKVEKGDALACLQALPSDSMIAVTAFHLVEHIGFDALRKLVLDALRVLKPGGLLIMETPNPENIVVATKNFHMDPSHLKPLPPELLAFLPEHAGYARVKTLRLQENPDICSHQNLSLEDVLGGASPDYAVVAQKRTLRAEPESLAISFSQSYGISMAELAQRYGQQQASQHALLAQQLAQTRHALAQTEALTAQLQLQLQQTQMETRYVAEQAASWGSQLTAVYNSRSWKITASLRWFNLQLMRLRQDGLIKRIKALFRKIFSTQQAAETTHAAVPPVESADPLQRLLVDAGMPEQQVEQLSPHTRRQLIQLQESGKTSPKD